MTLYKNLTLKAFEDVAMHFSKTLAAPHCVLLYGDLGAGKSTFARKIIQSLTTYDTIVPSPTFTLLQTYTTTHGPLAHFDLYRIHEEEEIFDLGFDDYIGTHICIIEWPERLGKNLPKNATLIRIEEASPTMRDLYINESTH